MPSRGQRSSYCHVRLSGRAIPLVVEQLAEPLHGVRPIAKTSGREQAARVITDPLIVDVDPPVAAVHEHADVQLGAHLQRRAREQGRGRLHPTEVVSIVPADVIAMLVILSGVAVIAMSRSGFVKRLSPAHSPSPIAASQGDQR